MKLLLVSLLFLSAPIGAQAAPQSTDATATAPTDQPVPAKPKKERKICRDEEKAGSHIGKRICKTAAEWQGTDDSDNNTTITGNRAH